MIDVNAVNVAEILEKEESKNQVKALQAAFEANPTALQVLEAAQSVEDAYHIAKNFVTLKLEEFKVLFDKTVEYFKSEKAVLNDEVLDTVSGGWSFSDLWNKYKKVIVAASIFVACMATGAVIGAAVGGFAGLVMGAYAGAAVGAFAGVGAAAAME